MTVENASMAEVAAAAQNASPLQPGQWEATVTNASVEVPGMAPEMQAMMQKQVGQQLTNVPAQKTCITAAQAQQPPSEMFGGKGSDACRWERFTMGSGKLDAVMVCRQMPGAPAGGEARMTMTGTMSGTSYDVASVMNVAMPATQPGGPTGMTIKTNVRGRRVGECSAT